MRCKACSTVWLVSGPSDAPAAAHAHVEHEATNKRAAVVRRGAEREKRDLFAVRDDGEGSVKETLLPPPSFGFAGGVGARNENSVLFRVDQLTAAARPKAPAPSVAPAPFSAPAPASTGGEPDDEGLIDLNALGSTPPRRFGQPVAPLFNEPPAVSVDVDHGVQRSAAKPATKMPLVGAIAAAAAFLLVAGLGISFAFKSEEPVKHAAAMVVEPSTTSTETSPTVAAAPVAAADEAKASTETTETTDAAEATGKKAKARAKGKGKARAAKGGTSTTKAPAAAPKTVKPADPCGCKGDFNCILACTAKRGK